MCRALVIDDDIISNHLSLPSKATGFMIDLIENSMRASDMLNSHYDIILADVGLPDRQAI